MSPALLPSRPAIEEGRLEGEIVSSEARYRSYDGVRSDVSVGSEEVSEEAETISRGRRSVHGGPDTV